MANAGSGGVRRRRVEGGRPHKFTVRFTDEELVQVAARAAAANTTVPGYLAMAGQEHPLFGDTAGGITAVQMRALAAELYGTKRLLRSLANNMNQLATVANSTGRVPDGLPPAADAVAGATARVEEFLTKLEPHTRRWFDTPTQPASGQDDDHDG